VGADKSKLKTKNGGMREISEKRSLEEKKAPGGGGGGAGGGVVEERKAEKKVLQGDGSGGLKSGQTGGQRVRERKTLQPPNPQSTSVQRKEKKKDGRNRPRVARSRQRERRQGERRHYGKDAKCAESPGAEADGHPRGWGWSKKGRGRVKRAAANALWRCGTRSARERGLANAWQTGYGGDRGGEGEKKKKNFKK